MIVVAFLVVQFIAYFALAFGHLSYRLGIKRALLLSLN